MQTGPDNSPTGVIPENIVRIDRLVRPMKVPYSDMDNTIGQGIPIIGWHLSARDSPGRIPIQTHHSW